MAVTRRDQAVARAVVVVPARDEAACIEACFAALAAQTVGADAFDVMLVADACCDDTAVRAASSIIHVRA